MTFSFKGHYSLEMKIKKSVTGSKLKTFVAFYSKLKQNFFTCPQSATKLWFKHTLENLGKSILTPLLQFFFWLVRLCCGPRTKSTSECCPRAKKFTYPCYKTSLQSFVFVVYLYFKIVLRFWLQHFFVFYLAGATGYTHIIFNHLADAVAM